MASLGTDVRFKLPGVCPQDGAPEVNGPRVRPLGGNLSVLKAHGCTDKCSRGGNSRCKSRRDLGGDQGGKGAQEAERTGREARLQGRTARARGLQRELVVFPTASGKPLEGAEQRNDTI